MKRFFLVIGCLLTIYFISCSKKHSTVQENDKVKIKDTDEIYSCAMHPEIIKPEQDKCPICGMELIHTLTPRQKHE